MPIEKPFFTSPKEIYMFDSINEELIDDMVGQFIDIYKILINDTNTNLYGESQVKYYNKAFRINCLIKYEAPEVDSTEVGSDLNTNIEALFHREALSNANFIPEIGDIIEWNNFYFEIGSVTEPQLIAGHYDYKHQIKVLAHRVRIASLQIEERTE
jgi:hypothetical protein